jgi:hypothetical protein
LSITASDAVFFKVMRFLAFRWLQFNRVKGMLLGVYWRAGGKKVATCVHDTLRKELLPIILDDAVKRFSNLPKPSETRNIDTVYPQDVLKEEVVKRFLVGVEFLADKVFEAELQMENPPREHVIFVSLFDGERILSLPEGNCDANRLFDVLNFAFNRLLTEEEKG